MYKHSIRYSTKLDYGIDCLSYYYFYKYIIVHGDRASLILYTPTGIPGLNLEKMLVFTVLNNNAAYVVTFGAE